MKNRGFTLVEVMIAAAISAIVILMTAAFLRVCVLSTTSEGNAPNEFGTPIALSPSPSQFLQALNFMGEFRDAMSTATWTAVANRPENRTSAPISGTLPAVDTLDGKAADPIGTFTSSLTANGYPFSASQGFSIFLFQKRDVMQSVISVEFHDFNGYRFYSVYIRDGSSTAPKAGYAFSEPLSSLQDQPMCQVSGTTERGGFSASFPDPSSTVSQQSAQLARTYTQPAALATATAHLNRTSGLSIVFKQGL